MNHTLKKLTPTEYEKEVLKILNASEHQLIEFNVQHDTKLAGSDGKYQIDIVATFRAFRVDYKTLVECKYYSSPVKREAVQVLKDKLHSTGAHKGILFSSSGFQKGAIEYASQNGIALIHFKDGSSSYVIRRSMSTPISRPEEVSVWEGWLISVSEDGKETQCLVSKDYPESLDKFIKG